MIYEILSIYTYGPTNDEKSAQNFMNEHTSNHSAKIQFRS